VKGRLHWFSARHFGFQIALQNEQIEGTYMDINMSDIDQFSVHVTMALDGKGRPAGVDGAYLISSTDPAVLGIEQTAPDLATVKALAPGVAQVIVAADVRLGPDANIVVQPIANVTVGLAEAKTFVVELGPVEEQP
jgi:hypothetical protein